MVRLAFAISLLLLSATNSTGAQLDIDGDTDRTGIVENSQTEEQLEPTKSVILLNNCDRELNSTSRDPDNVDNRINGANDLEDLEPIILRRVDDPRNNITLKLTQLSEDSLPEEKRIRVFGIDGREILGPSTGTEYALTESELATLVAHDLTYYAEGLQFSTSVKLEVVNSGVVDDGLTLEVAPFIFTPHTLPVRENYVSATGSAVSQRFVQAFEIACQQAGVTPVSLRSRDIWVEDELTWGYTESPRKKFDVAFHMLRQRDLEANVKALLGPDVGWFEAFDYVGTGLPHSELTYGGNVEISPPTPNNPFGRVYYGSKILPDDGQNVYIKRAFHAQFKAFFERQNLQPPIELHTNWLAVGHIDEIVSFIPKTTGDGAVMILSSPKLGFDILRTLPQATPLNSRYELEFGITSVGEFFRATSLQRTLEQYNLEIDRHIFGLDHAHPSADSIKSILMQQLGIEESDIAEVPTVFYNTSADEWSGLALTPGVVNVSSMGKFSLIPEPFLDEFKAATKSVIEVDGRQALWIDNWSLYHANSGEVHCGSQERRESFTVKWWE